jgi:hypothetical protein
LVIPLAIAALLWRITVVQRVAIISAQKSEILKVGGKYSEDATSLHMVTEADLSSAKVDARWLLSKLDNWEYHGLRRLRLPNNVSVEVVERLRLILPACEIVLDRETAGGAAGLSKDAGETTKPSSDAEKALPK